MTDQSQNSRPDGTECRKIFEGAADAVEVFGEARRKLSELRWKKEWCR